MIKRKLQFYFDRDKDHFYDCIQEFTVALENLKVPRLTIKHKIRKYTLFLKLARSISSRVALPRFSFLKSSTSVLTAQIGPNLDLFVTKSLTGGDNYLYVFDCWEPYIKWLLPMSKTLRLKTIFFSTKQACELFNMSNKGVSPTRAMWIPEGIQLNDYRFLAYTDKNIDVLEFGRKYELLHNEIKNALHGTHYNHVFQVTGASPLFPDRKTFVEGLAASKICICVPSNVTHPERAGNISTMTLRYLQAMASKCLIVGILPYDMRELFPHNPVVEVDFDKDIGSQLISILDNFENYLDLIELNYFHLVNNHTWECRISKMLSYIRSER